MGRGVSAGGGQSSLGYLFGSGEAPSKSSSSAAAAAAGTAAAARGNSKAEEKQIPAGVRGSPNNYLRSEGQNCGNFLTDRPSTKVHAAPGGGSSLGYLFGGGSAPEK
ncbi:PREDICTED: protein SPIRAL1-like 2 [Tarenaya hassleriana]|uniref:protein SPIRAL1-like 2 n=1 Tax=Tarenaya hassleriana TaxID=28532 RepID=UPI00053C4CD8|nr:PREDICTED: protein SPIRAL1-like 2 [Tarenaya hassleriana]